MMTASLIKSSAQLQDYYAADDYYSERGHGKSQYYGGLAAEVGLAGQTGAAAVEAFNRIAHGYMPGGTSLLQNGGKSHRLPVDLTYSTAKSFTIMALAHPDPDVRAKLMEIYHRAVKLGLDRVESGIGTRVTVGGETQHVTTGKLLAQLHEHHTNRDGGLHLHTHCLIPNVTQLSDGSYRAMDNSTIFKLKKEYAATVDAFLRRETQALGFEVSEPDKHGNWDIVGVPQELIAEYSTRSAAVADYLHKMGLTRETASHAEKQVACNADRKPKARIEHEAILAVARARCAEFHLPTPDANLASPKSPNARHIEALQWAADHLTARESAMTLKEFRFQAIVHGADPDKIMPSDIESIAGLKLGVRQTVTGSGRKTRTHTEHYVISTTALMQEQELIRAAQLGRGKASAIIADEAEARRLMAAPITTADGEILRDDKGEPVCFNPEQQEFGVRFLTGVNQDFLLQGVAGAGKTAVMQRVFAVARASGYEIIGLAPSNKAVGELREASGQGQTIASFLAGNREIGPRTIVVVDEFGMVGIDDAYRLRMKIGEAGARFLGSGDTRQFTAVSNGSPFALLQRRVPSIVTYLNQSVRAKADHLKAAYEDAAKGRTAKALDRLQAKGAVHEIKRDDTRQRAIAKAYLALSEAEKDQTLMITATNAARLEINAYVRKALGLVGKGIELDVLRPADVTPAELRKTSSYKPGMVVQLGADTDHARRGAQLEVVAVSHRDRTITVRSRAGKEFGLPLPTRDQDPGTLWQLLHKERMEFAAGDRILMKMNLKGEVKGAPNLANNGDMARVLRIDSERQTVTLAVGKEQREITIDNHGERTPVVTHGYAVTGNSAQGATVARVLIDMKAKAFATWNAFYTNMTRAKFEAVVFTDNRSVLKRYITKAAQKLNASDIRLNDRKPSADLMKSDPAKPPAAAARDRADMVTFRKAFAARLDAIGRAFAARVSELVAARSRSPQIDSRPTSRERTVERDHGLSL